MNSKITTLFVILRKKEMEIKIYFFNDLRTCCYIAWDETGECVIIDPGCNSESERSRLKKFISENELKPVMLLNTHGHFDHVMGNRFITDTYGVKTYIHKDDNAQLARATSYCDYFGYKIEAPDLDTIAIADGDILKFGNSELKVIHTPGHTMGGVCFVAEKDKVVFTGDTLFAGSIGRTDLPGGDFDLLAESLREKLMTLDPDYRVLPGHGPETTIDRKSVV